MSTEPSDMARATSHGPHCSTCGGSLVPRQRCECDTYTGSERRPDGTKVCERCGKPL